MEIRYIVIVPLIKIPKDFKQRDFVRLFGQIKTSIDDNSKEHSNVRMLTSKLLNAKEQIKKDRKKYQKRLKDKYIVSVVLGQY